jgi:hypothetical protein
MGLGNAGGIITPEGGYAPGSSAFVLNLVACGFRSRCAFVSRAYCMRHQAHYCRRKFFNREENTC